VEKHNQAETTQSMPIRWALKFAKAESGAPGIYQLAHPLGKISLLIFDEYRP
jgi:hypothetical protein